MLSVRGLRRVLAAFDAVLLLSGVTLITVGSYVHVQLGPQAAFYTGRLGTPVILIVMGVLAFPLAGFLALALMRESHQALWLSAAILGTMVACEVGAAIASFEYQHVIGQAVRDSVQRDLDACQGSGLDSVQQRLRCCGGFHGAGDYASRALNVPNSCCPRSCQASSPYRDTCDSRLEELFKRNMIRVGVTAIVLLCVHFLGVLLSCWLGQRVAADNALTYTVNE